MQIEITEREFQDQIIELAKIYKWMIHHDRPAMTGKGWRTAIQGDKGWPDLCLVRDERIIFAETKSETGKLSEEQKEWLDILEATKRCEVYTWRPSQWPEIVLLLK